MTLALAVAATVMLYVVPFGYYIAYPLVLISTFVHEMGHAIAGILVGARFDEFVMYSDASGSARISGGTGRLASTFIAAGGLVGPSVAAALLFGLCTRTNLARIGLWAEESSRWYRVCGSFATSSAGFLSGRWVGSPCSSR